MACRIERAYLPDFTVLFSAYHTISVCASSNIALEDRWLAKKVTVCGKEIYAAIQHFGADGPWRDTLGGGKSRAQWWCS